MLETGHTLGRYRVENQLGAGGMGEVYRAWDSVLQRWIALKVVPQGDKRAERLLGEARAAAALRHANIVSVYDVGETDGFAFVSMDLVEGRPLRDWIGDANVKLEDKIAWLVQIASALRAAHKAGFVHRDMKPDNVMITTSGEARVLDFGLAKAFSVDVTAATQHAGGKQGYLTVDGSVSGTPAYMAPEQRFPSMDAVATALGAPPSGSSSPYAIAASNPPSAPSVPSASMNVQIGDTLQVPIHPNAPAPQKRSRRPLVLGLVVASVLGASALVGWRMRAATTAEPKPPASTPVETVARTADPVPSVTASAPVVVASAPPSASALAALATEIPRVHAPPPMPAPRKLVVTIRAIPSAQYDARAIERTVNPLRPSLKACFEQHPPNTLPATVGVSMELWNIGDEIGKVRDARIHEPPALTSCMYDLFMSLTFGPQKDSRLPPGAVFVNVTVEGT